MTFPAILRGVSQEPLWDVPVHHVPGLGSARHAAELHHLYYAVCELVLSSFPRSSLLHTRADRDAKVAARRIDGAPRRALSASSSSSSSSDALRTRLVPMWGIQTGLGIPKHTDAALWNSSFISSYSLIGMTLENMPSSPTGNTHGTSGGHEGRAKPRGETEGRNRGAK